MTTFNFRCFFFPLLMAGLFAGTVQGQQNQFPNYIKASDARAGILIIIPQSGSPNYTKAFNFMKRGIRKRLEAMGINPVAFVDYTKESGKSLKYGEKIQARLVEAQVNYTMTFAWTYVPPKDGRVEKGKATLEEFGSVILIMSPYKGENMHSADFDRENGFLLMSGDAVQAMEVIQQAIDGAGNDYFLEHWGVGTTTADAATSAAIEGKKFDYYPKDLKEETLVVSAAIIPGLTDRKHYESIMADYPFPYKLVQTEAEAEAAKDAKYIAILGSKNYKQYKKTDRTTGAVTIEQNATFHYVIQDNVTKNTYKGAGKVKAYPSLYKALPLKGLVKRVKTEFGVE